MYDYEMDKSRRKEEGTEDKEYESILQNLKENKRKGSEYKSGICIA